jgi:GDP-D-mannose 3',5'-epimerase
MKRAVVCSASGFIVGHLIKRLKSMGYCPRGIDIQRCDPWQQITDEFFTLNLCVLEPAKRL